MSVPSFRGPTRGSTSFTIETSRTRGGGESQDKTRRDQTRTGIRTRMRMRGESGERERADRRARSLVQSVGFDADGLCMAALASRIPINNETKELRERENHPAPSGWASAGTRPAAIFTSDNEPPADIYIFNSINPQSPAGSLMATRFPFRSPFRLSSPRLSSSPYHGRSPSTTPPRTPFISLN